MTDQELLALVQETHSTNLIIVEVQRRVEQAARAVTSMANTVAQIAQHQAAIATALEQQIIQRELEAILSATAAIEYDDQP